MSATKKPHPRQTIYFDRPSTHYNLRIKQFPDHLKLSCFSKPIFNPEKLERAVDKPKCSEKRSYDVEHTRRDSLKRTIDKATEIAYSNEWQYFVTLTLDRQKISRTDVSEIRRVLVKWLSNKVQRNDLRYLVFPEYHADGQAIHFHGLMAGKLDLQDSGKVTKRGQTIYNTESWPYGFTTVVHLTDNIAAVSQYIMKYITKDCKKIFGKYYFAGGKISREVPTSYDNVLYDDFEGEEYQVPNARLSVKYKPVPLDECGHMTGD